MQLKMKGWMTYAEAAAVLSVAEETIRKHTQRGVLERAYIGRQPLVSETSVRRYLKTRRMGTTAKRDRATGRYVKS